VADLLRCVGLPCLEMTALLDEAIAEGTEVGVGELPRKPRRGCSTAVYGPRGTRRRATPMVRGRRAGRIGDRDDKLAEERIRVRGTSATSRRETDTGRAGRPPQAGSSGATGSRWESLPELSEFPSWPIWRNLCGFWERTSFSFRDGARKVIGPRFALLHRGRPCTTGEVEREDPLLLSRLAV
jgi:hypothetical protein